MCYDIKVLDDNSRHQILESLLEIISGIASKQYQERVWIQGLGPEVDDFDETVNNFFDIGDPIFHKLQDYGFTPQQYQLLNKLKEDFEAFADDYDWPPEFIDSQEWAKIMELAQQVLDAFNYQGPIYIKLTKNEYDYLRSANYIQQHLFLSNLTEEYILVIRNCEADKLCTLCQQQLKLINNGQNPPNSQEKQILESLVNTLKKKEPPLLINNQQPT